MRWRLSFVLILDQFRGSRVHPNIIVSTSSFHPPVGDFHPSIEPSKGTPEKGYDDVIKDGEGLSTLSGRAEWSLMELTLNGLEPRRLGIETSFGTWCKSWIPRMLLTLIRHSASTTTEDLQLTLPSMSPLPTLSSLEKTLMTEMTGEDSLISNQKDYS